MAVSTVYTSADNWLDKNAPTTNRNSLNLRVGDQGGSDGARSILTFTMPADPGGGVVIDSIVFKMKMQQVGGGSSISIDMYSSKSSPATIFDETTSTWNNYSTGNAWTAAGALSDFDTDIRDTTTVVPADDETYLSWVLVGTGATNPATLTWGETFTVLMRSPSSLALQFDFYRRETTGTVSDPKVEVTYSAAATTTPTLMMMGVGS